MARTQPKTIIDIAHKVVFLSSKVDYSLNYNTIYKDLAFILMEKVVL
ncbi:hypothetical protein M23134_03688 [Microscilla marina ATCC 23134]|uniref:Uncharacterized protein n=1 Tax=Microscilla marina ATCC 23134 TaxID=313606 RepID=A1ZXA0_MICM2|nr:hypothetical protein M23134_03688 [Microscilla marina ATCC 23134]